MQKLTLGDPDEGIAEMTIGSVTKKLDVFETQNNLHVMANESREQPVHVLHKKVVDYVQSLGFPPISHKKANDFINVIYAEVKRLEGFTEPATGPDAASPSSTPSTAEIGQSAT